MTPDAEREREIREVFTPRFDENTGGFLLRLLDQARAETKLATNAIITMRDFDQRAHRNAIASSCFAQLSGNIKDETAHPAFVIAGLRTSNELLLAEAAENGQEMAAKDALLERAKKWMRHAAFTDKDAKGWLADYAALRGEK